MDDRHDSKLKNEIDEITARIKIIMAKVKKLDPVKNEASTQGENQETTPEEV